MYKTSSQCRQISFDTYTSFEMQQLQLNVSSPVFFAVVYHPPKCNKVFADFLSGVTVRYDQFLIAGDFNIHVCYESKPMVNDFFFYLIASNNVVPSVTGLTHEKLYTLDLMLLFGQSMHVDDICEMAYISDHLLFLFTVSIPCSRVKTFVSTCHMCMLTPHTATLFFDMFNELNVCCTAAGNLAQSFEELLCYFDFLCTNILNSVTPLRPKHTKVLSEP